MEVKTLLALNIARGGAAATHLSLPLLRDLPDRTANRLESGGL